MIFRTSPEALAEKAASISSLTYGKLVAEYNLRAHPFGAELDTFGKYGSMSGWLKDALAETFAVVLTELDAKPVWSDAKCPSCHEALGIHANLAPNSGTHMKCAWARAESLTHDDSKECGVALAEVIEPLLKDRAIIRCPECGEEVPE